MTTHKIEQALAMEMYRSLGRLLQFKGMTLGAVQLFVDVINQSMEEKIRNGHGSQDNELSSTPPTLELAWTQRPDTNFPDTDLRFRVANGTLKNNLEWPSGYCAVDEKLEIEKIFPKSEDWERELVGTYLPYIVEIGEYLRCLNKSARLVEEIGRLGASQLDG